MQTSFSADQLANPVLKEADGILRNCVHCGFCTATCPTYVLLGDELDSPRGRISLIKEMLEQEKPANAEVATHIDRCLSCYACMSTCPSGVDYMHLMDTGRAHVEETYARPVGDLLLRRMLGSILPYPGRFRVALALAALARPFARLLPARLRAMVSLAPRRPPERFIAPGVYPAQGPRRQRMALLTGCVQSVIEDRINAATVRILNRHGVEVVVKSAATCCGALNHHMGREAPARAAAAQTIAAWMEEVSGPGLDAIVINTSGCGTTVKDYGHLFRDDPQMAAPAAKIGALAKDITEVLKGLNLKPAAMNMRVAYHSACSLQHGQRITTAPAELLRAAGFEVVTPAEPHLCCGSAGTYNMLQPELSQALRDRKAANLRATKPQVICAGNVGCLVQIRTGVDVPVVHTVELLDWATGGPAPL